MPTSRVSRKPHLTLAALSAAALLVAACSSGSPSPQASTSGSGPVTLTNCGTEVTYPKQASRIVATSNSANIGTLIRIGAVQNLAAVSLQKGNDEVLSALYSPGIENVPRLQNPISMESIVSTEPDLLIGSYSGLFSGSSGVTPEAAAEQNIPTYVISDSCRQDPAAGSSSKLGTMDPWDAVRTDIQNYGALTGRTAEATEALTEFNTQLAELQQAPAPTKKPRILLFDSGTNELYTSGRNGPPQGIIDAAGGVNVFENQDTTWFKASWESVAETQPDVTSSSTTARATRTRSRTNWRPSAPSRRSRTSTWSSRTASSSCPSCCSPADTRTWRRTVQIRKGLEQMGMAPESPVKGKLPESLGYGVLKS